MNYPCQYPAYCIPCLAKRECCSLPHSVNCEKLRRVDVQPVAPTKPQDPKP
jgi:hypothetical protein